MRNSRLFFILLMFTLRPYQSAAVAATYNYLRNHDGDPVVVAPTGSGKSLLAAQFTKDAVTKWNGRVLVVTHVKELIEQNADKIRQLCPEIPVGIFSASLKGRDTTQPAICAGIQSIYERACELGAFDLILIDEAHLIGERDDSMYGKFLHDARVINPSCRLCGLTATPFRTDNGLIYGPDRLFSDVCYEIGIRELIRDGLLAPLVTKASLTKVETGQLHVRGGDFVAGEVEDLMDTAELVEAACGEIVALTKDRQACLIFAAGVAHARHIVHVFKEQHGLECGLLTGTTPLVERAELIRRFRGKPSGELFDAPPLKYLCGVNTVSTGLDVPRIDALAMLRPTLSPGLYMQQVGRAFRLSPGKQDALILDFAGNVVRHGPVDAVRIREARKQGTGEAPAKECPQCQSIIAAGYAACPDCGYEFPPPETSKHDAEASTEGILSGQVTDNEYDVLDIFYSVHTKKGAAEDAPQTMRVDYQLGLAYTVSEWVCFEHTGYARRKAEQWWRRRSPDPIPDSVEEGVGIANAGGVASADRVTVRTIAGEPFERIIDYELRPIPEAVGSREVLDLSDVPF